MSTQQDIYAAGSENRPHMLNKENYVPWSSRLLWYAKSRPTGKLIHNSIINGPYVRRMILEPGDPNREVPVNETFHVQTDDELTEKELKQIETDDQDIQTILLGLPEDIYATVDSCETAQEIWLRVQQMMKGSEIGIQKKKAKLFNELERFTSTDGESIESYYHCFLMLMNDLKRNKHFPEKIADITDPTTTMNMALALMSKAFKLNYSTPTNNNQRISSNLHNRQIAQPGNLNGYNAVQNVRNQVAQNAIQNPRIQNIRNQNGQMVVPGTNQNPNGNGNLVAARAEGNATGHNGNQIRCYNCRGVGHFARNCTIKPRRRDVAYLQTQLLIAQKEEVGIQLQAEEFDLMAAAADLDEIEEVNANCILMANLQQASTSGTETDKAPVYDSDGSVEYTELLEPIPEPHQVPHNDNNVISEGSSVEQSGGTVEQHPANVEKTRVLYDSLYNNLAIEVEKVNMVNRKLSETNAELATKLARYKNQEKCFEISQEKYDKLERCYQKSVYQKHCLSKKINDLYLSFGKQIITLNEEISNLNKQLSVEKSTVSSLLKEKKRLKSDFKIREDELLDKQIQLEKKIKELDNILVKMEFSDDTTPSVARKFLNEVKSTIVTLQRVVKQRMDIDTHNWSSSAHQELHKIVKDEIFPIVNQVDARVQNFEIQFLKEAGKFVGDFKFLAKEADESLAKHKALELEIKRLLRAVVSQDIMSVVQNNSVDETLNLQTKLERTKERFENCIIKKENEYAKLWNDWWSPTGRLFDLKGKIITSSELESQSDCSKGDNACTSNPLEPTIKRFPNFTFSLAGYPNMFMEIAQQTFTPSISMKASASPICLMAHATSTKSWLWHQRLSHLNFDTINDLAKNDLVSGLPKFKYHKEHLCPSCEQEKSKRASNPPKPVPNARQRLHLLHMDLCGPMRNASINGKRKMDISFLHVFGALCYLKNDREDIGKLGAKGVLDLLFEAMYDDYISGQPSAALRTVPAAQAHRIRQTPMTSTSIADTAPTPTNSSSHVTNFLNYSQDVDKLNSQQQHAQQQGYHAPF
nr:retrovirus-related Pol polyprotein from transposon TNT 1-94 [Tanacetum cinerariifolium]